jgi:DHA1 family multidrug resistance protein-like MFS transporter
MIRNRTLLAVSFAVAAAYTGIGMVGPVRVLYARQQGASLEIIGAMASAYLIANFVAQYPTGWLADRWGRRRMMIIGLVAQALLAVAYIFVVDPLLFVVLRCAEGLAAASMLPSARALIADAVPDAQRGRAYGFFGACFNFGFLLGPAIGGLLASTNYASAFWGAALCRVVALVIVLLLVPSSQVLESALHARTAVAPRRAIFRLPLVGAYILAFGDYLYLGFDLALMPLWMHDHLGASVAVIGLAYVAWAIPGVIVTPFGGRIADRSRRSRLILIFGLAQVPIYVVYGLTTTIWLVIGFFAVQAVLYSCIQPAVDAHVAVASPVEARARVQGMYSTFGLMGAFAGANLLTPLYTLDFRLPLFVLGAGYGLCVLVGGLLIRRAERHGLVGEPAAAPTPAGAAPGR